MTLSDWLATITIIMTFGGTIAFVICTSIAVTAFFFPPTRR